MELIGRHLNTLSPQATAMSCAALAIMIFFMKFVRRIPGSIVVLFAGTAIAWGLNLQIETIDTRFGGIPSGFPSFQIPHFHTSLIMPLLAPALTIAMLGAIESLLSAVV